jgi:hypothetical protein
MDGPETKSALIELLEARGGVWLIVLAIWGGTASYINRLKASDKKFKLVELFGEWIISGFAGMATAYLCFALDLSWHVTCFMSGIAGHMGARAIFVFENRFKKTFGG